MRYTRNGSGVCDDCAILSDKNCNYDRSEVLLFLTKGDDTALAAVVLGCLFYTP